MDLGAPEDYGELEMGVGRQREVHESLGVRYRMSPACLGCCEVDLGAPEDYGELKMGVGRLRDMYSGTGESRDTNRAGFVWEVYPDLTPPPEYKSLGVRYWKSPACPGGREANLGALEDDGKL